MNKEWQWTLNHNYQVQVHGHHPQYPLLICIYLFHSLSLMRIFSSSSPVCMNSLSIFSFSIFIYCLWAYSIPLILSCNLILSYLKRLFYYSRERICMVVPTSSSLCSKTLEMPILGFSAIRIPLVLSILVDFWLDVSVRVSRMKVVYLLILLGVRGSLGKE